MRRLATCTMLMLALPRLASACPVCFGASDGPMLQGSNMGILVLLVLTVAMLAAFGAFFATLARRAARAATTDLAAQEWAAVPQERGASR